MALQVDHWSYFTLINQIISPLHNWVTNWGPPPIVGPVCVSNRGFNDVKSGVWLKIHMSNENNLVN